MCPKPISNADIVASYLDAILRRDSTAVDHYFDPDVEYIVNGTSDRDAEKVLPPISEECRQALPWLGLHRGRGQVKSFLECLQRNLDVTAYGPRQVVSEGNRAAAFGWFRLHALSTGRTVDIAYSIFFELRDGRFIKYHFLENTFDVASAFRAGGVWELEREGIIHRVPELPRNGKLR